MSIPVGESENEKTSDKVLRIVSYLITFVFWLGLSCVIFILLFINPRFDRIYTELQVPFNFPTDIVIHHNYILILLIALYGLTPFLFKMIRSPRKQSIGLILYGGLGIFSTGILMGFIIVSLYFPIFNITH